MSVHPEDEFEEEPLLEELAFDDTLDSLTRLEKFCISQAPLQRQVLARELADTAHEHGAQQTLNRLVPLLDLFVRDTEPLVRHALVGQFLPLAQFLITTAGDGGYEAFTHSILPPCFVLLVDKNVEVSIAAAGALRSLADLVRPEDVEDHLLNVIHSLSVDERAEDYRVAAALLYNRLAPVFRTDLCVRAVIGKLTALAEDPSFAVRRTVAASLDDVGRVVGPQVCTEQLLPLFQGLAKDPHSTVRKSAARALATLATTVTAPMRTRVLWPLHEALLGDPSQWVRGEAQMVLAELLATCRPGESAGVLLGHMSRLLQDAVADSHPDPALAQAVAERFPQVVKALGAEEWDTLAHLFLRMARSQQVQVRKWVVKGITEIAEAIGPKRTEEDVLRVYESFLSDVDEVRFPAVGQIATFVPAVPAARRGPLFIFVTSSEMPANWRFRELFARRMAPLIPILDAAVVRDHATPAITRFLEDSVAHVRVAALPAAAAVITYAAEKGSIPPVLRDHVVQLASAGTCFQRQLFCQLAEVAAKACPRAVLTDVFVPRVIQLAQDAVTTVRLTAAAAVLGLSETLVGNVDLRTTLTRLQSDGDPDVSRWADPANRSPGSSEAPVTATETGEDEV
eukprot:TRINITY_DN67868_c0_g1_i1.p1 TRINITY_DN67868_c0_g1~~TRINITY_DN67868_c0_g1_i1.p1  ORF type:complete len:625 (-),score=163.72 TRINITY_DN67868_c0_g1_i1:219-2093(-)